MNLPTSSIPLISGKSANLTTASSAKLATILSIAASLKPHSGRLLFYLDVHLHRIEVTRLEQNDHLLHKDVETLSGKGISYLYSEWVKAVADEFVRTTRFDPFDQAIYEQELYRRLPHVLRELQMHSSVMFEMKAGSRTYGVTLTYDLFAKKSEAVFREVCQLIEEMTAKNGKKEMPLALEITHRVRSLPGFKEETNRIENIEIIELEVGSGAFGVLTLQDRFAMQTASDGVTFLTSRSWQEPYPSKDSKNGMSHGDPVHPTHILYNNLAYPISAKPLIVGQGTESDISIRIKDQVTHVSRKHCTIQKNGDDVLLVNHSNSGTFVDGTNVYDDTPAAIDTYYEVDCSSVVGAQRTMILLRVEFRGTSSYSYCVARPDDDASNFPQDNDPACNRATVGATQGDVGYLWVMSSAAGKLEVLWAHFAQATKLYVEGYVKC